MGYDNDARRNAAYVVSLLEKLARLYGRGVVFVFRNRVGDGKKRVARPIRARLNDRHS